MREPALAAPADVVGLARPAETAAGFPLSVAQKRIWSLGLVGAHGVFPAQTLALIFERAPDDASLRALAAIHPSLRTRFRRFAGGRIEQVAAPAGELVVERLDLALHPGESEDAALERVIDAFAARPFDLDRELAGRVARIALPGGRSAIAFTLHPIVADPTSLRVLARDLAAAANGETLGSPRDGALTLAPAEQAWLRAPAFAETLEHWRTAFAGEHAAATLPLKNGLGAAAAGLRGRSAFRIAPETVWGLEALGAREGLPLPTLVFAGFHTLLARYSGQWALRTGVVIENRADPARAATVGRFEDVAPLHLDVASSASFVALARAAQAKLDEALAHHAPIERLAQELWRHEGDASESLVKTLFEFREALGLEGAGPLTRTTASSDLSPPGRGEDPRLDADASEGRATAERATSPRRGEVGPQGRVRGPREADITSDGVKVLPRPLAARADTDFILTVQPAADGGLDAVMDYAEGLYDGRLVARAAEGLARVLRAAADDGDVRLRDIALVAPDELDWLSAPYPDDAVDDDRPVHELIAEHAARTPDKVAILYAEESWTHGALDRFANRLAHRLVREGVGPEDCVAIAVKRSPQAIGAMLATLKAGGAYIPVEPDHPAVRNDHIFRDAGVKVIVTNSWLTAKIPTGVDAVVLELDRIDLEAEPAAAPETPPVHDDQLAYVMYTSGSTGLPKGVGVEHGPLTHHLQSTARVYGMTEISRELPFLPFSSDGGHERWMNPLMVGGSIILPDQPLWTPEETLAAMRRHGANNASIPTTYLQQLAEEADANASAPPMRLYSFGGEGLPQTTFELLSRSLNSEWLINGYGPTETIMTPMVWKVRAGARFEGTYAPLGWCVGRRRAYVLDADLNPCPIGVTGELYLGGEGVARGYLGRPGVTADRFMPDPFSPEGGRLYRSGDMTRWREDGSVEFVGRVDHQVKLRGFRIELGEIEAALLAQDGVGESLVILREDDGRKALVAYVVPKAGATLDGDALRRALVRELPDYMVPAAVVPLERMPTNPNSKLDRMALPAPKLKLSESVPPATPLEEELLALWKQVLNVEALGVTDNFFEIGGHSLAAVKIVSRLRALKPKAKVTIADLFNEATVRKLAASIERGGEATGGQVIRLRDSGSKPMLYCFPGLLVSTREYVKLVDFLGPEQPATGFICYSLSEEKKLDASVEEITGAYVDHIRKESAGRPCFFLGWSWGGLLAYEAARQLGSDIDLRLVGMIDVCDLGTEFAIGAVPQFAPGERDELQRLVTEWLGRTRMRADWDRLLGSMDARTYDQFLRFVGDEEESLPTDGPDISSREHTFWILIDNALIFRRHVLQPFDAPIHSWAAEDSLHRGLNLMDWRRLSRRANPAEIIAGTNHLHVIGSSAFHSRFAARLDEAMAGLDGTERRKRMSG
ncbi:non-ribosomal peptide synthetase [Methylopila sp. 73B]|uniref:non-ribosomal peptide synthetase n=1 Tax=Methylopila sp. 73B TaxID=1120792 RepID=UPI000369BBF0|nr:non-ribosomal peptide synthetase [Methylopila sp. 73B]